jgi:Phage integrase, N-terminal SAM-like domain
MTGFVEKRGPSRWRARYRGPDRRERSKTFARRVDAERWLAGISVAMTRGEWTDPARARMSVGEWSQQWLTSRAPSLKATTRESYRSLLSTCILPTWGRVPLSVVTHADVADWVAQLSTVVGPSRCRKAATLLSGIMAGAVRDQRIPRNPCEGVRLPRLPPQQQRFLTLPQLQLLADCAGDYRTMVLVSGCAAFGSGSAPPCGCLTLSHCAGDCEFGDRCQTSMVDSSTPRRRRMRNATCRYRGSWLIFCSKRWRAESSKS